MMLIILLVVGAAALAGAFLCEEKNYEVTLSGSGLSTLEYTDEMIADLLYFDVFVPADENRDLQYDLYGCADGDGQILILLPNDVPRNNVALYFTDIEGNLLARRVYDLTRTVMVGDKPIVTETLTLPVMCFESLDHRVYQKMIESDSKDIICDGNMHLCVSKSDSHRFGWNRLYKSYESKNDVSTASLRGRGSISWRANCKKSFSLHLNDAMELLGMGSHKNWNLIGNAYDISLLKNEFFNRLADQAGVAYQPAMQNINLFVDGRYQGVYTLSTKVTADANRIPLISGDFLYKMDPPEADQPVRYESETWFPDGGYYPFADIIYPEKAPDSVLSEGAEKLQCFIDAVEDPSGGKLSDVCDIDSLARYYWIEEASMNYDAWQRSTFMYYTKKDGLMHMGPVWDMDRTLGSPYTKNGISFDSPEGWKVRCAGWYTRLFDNEEFQKAVYEQYFYGGIREVLRSSVSEFEKEKDRLGRDGDINYTVYGHSNDMGAQSVYGNVYDYDVYTYTMIDFYKARVDWIDEQMSLLL